MSNSDDKGSLLLYTTADGGLKIDVLDDRELQATPTVAFFATFSISHEQRELAHYAMARKGARKRTVQHGDKQAVERNNIIKEGGEA